MPEPAIEREHLEQVARQSILELAGELSVLARKLPDGLFEAVPLILAATPPIVISGVGKSGIVAHKIAATMRSTGTPALYLHAGDASHGDIGMVPIEGCAILISWSGETEELLRIVPALRERRCKLIVMTGARDSTLGKLADVAIDCTMRARKGGGWLVPTTSTGLLMALGDALAQMLRSIQRIGPSEIARLHPGGAIGDRLRQRVGDVMHSDHLPICGPDDQMAKVAGVMTRGGLGAVLVMEARTLCGIITDGDIRRSMERGATQAAAREVMSAGPRTIGPDELVVVALERMHKAKITIMVVADKDGEVIGMLSIHD